MAGASSSSSSRANMIVEERTEMMVPPTNEGKPCLRAAYFLRPSAVSVASPIMYPPIPTPFLDENPNENLPMEVQFLGWNHPLNNWQTWIEQMHALHHLTWRESGIYEAIMSSKYRIHRNEHLMLRFAERWCPDMNIFMFPWGEATVTLEDVKVLGGFSILGASNLTAIGDDGEMNRIKDVLVDEIKKIKKTALRKASQTSWIATFMNKGSEFEHQAFLTYWLSRFVFPKLDKDTIGESLIPMAIHLSRGRRIALAPAVLASIYKDLRVLKQALDDLRKPGFDGALKIKLYSPLQLLHVWIWERFPALQPRPNLTQPDDPRMAKWEKIKFDVQNISNFIDSDDGLFLWRPYSRGKNNTRLRLTGEDVGKWVRIDPEVGQDVTALARCWRPSELVGPDGDYIEQYLPHRVAMQFGMDQDVPGLVPRVNSSPQAAWSYYSRPVEDEQLYIPARLFEPDVTATYYFWSHRNSLTQHEEEKPGEQSMFKRVKLEED